MKNKKRLLRMLALLAVSVALAFGLEALQIATQPKRYEPELRVVQEAGEIDLESCEGENAEYKNSALTIGSEGGSLTADLGEEREMPFLQIWAKKHLKKDVTLQVYYAGAGEDFSEERSVMLTADTGAMAWEPAVPAGKYQKLKIVSDGKISIGQILYSDPVEERVPIAESMRLWRVPLVAALLFCVLLFLVHMRAGHRLADMLQRAVKGLTESGKRTAVHTVLFLAAGLGGYFLAKALWLGGFGADMNYPRQLFCAGAGLVLACLVTFRRTLGRKPEALFLVISLCAGSLMVFLFPETPLVSWDDEYHYDQALTWSYLGEERLTVQDSMNIIADVEVDDNFVLGEPRQALMAKHQEQYEQGIDFVKSKPLEAKNNYEIFAAAGLFLGRVLGLPYYWVYCLGKFFNLLAYTVCGFFAVRRLKSGKMMLAAVLLMPSAVFLASVYAYDPGLTAFTALGLAYCFAEWQEPEKRMTLEHAAIMVCSLTLGCLTKAVYFPLLLIPLLLPKAKFREKGRPAGCGEITRRAFIGMNLAAMLILLATFMIPTLTGGAEGDIRGGENIDAYGQIFWVLRHPFEYAGILLTFLADFLGLHNAPGLVSSFAYMGYGSWSRYYLALLLILALTDRDSSCRRLERSAWGRIGTLIAVLAALVLVCTALYVMYTPVALNWINGVQHRYLIPLIFPLLMVLGSGLISRPQKLEIPWRRSLYNGLMLACMAFVLLSGVWDACVSRFVG